MKGNRQGVLSRSITRRGGRIAKENATIFYFAILEAAWRKRPEGAFLTSWGADSRARRIAADPNRLSIKQGRPKVCHCCENVMQRVAKKRKKPPYFVAVSILTGIMLPGQLA